MTNLTDDGAWFAPKRFGYGAGLPITRAGWIVTIGYILLITGAAFLVPYSFIAFGVIVLAATAAFLVVTAQKTRGGWHWRWGGKD